MGLFPHQWYEFYQNNFCRENYLPRKVDPSMCLSSARYFTKSLSYPSQISHMHFTNKQERLHIGTRIPMFVPRSLSWFLSLWFLLQTLSSYTCTQRNKKHLSHWSSIWVFITKLACIINNIVYNLDHKSPSKIRNKVNNDNRWTHEFGWGGECIFIKLHEQSIVV